MKDNKIVELVRVNFDSEEKSQEIEMVRAGFTDVLRQTGLIHIIFVGSLLLTLINVLSLYMIDPDSFKSWSRSLLFGVTLGLILGIAVVVQSIVDAGIYFKCKARS
jgi:uncharacterized membrane protein (DUF485 family)